MSTATLRHANAPAPATLCDRDLAMVVLVVLSSVYFLKPQELFSALQVLRIYALLAVVCFVLCRRQVLDQIGTAALRRNPITACMFGLATAVVLSHLQFARLHDAFFAGVRYTQLTLLYLLLVGLLDEPRRYMRFLGWIAWIILGTTVLSMLFFFHLLPSDGLAVEFQKDIDGSTGSLFYFPRLMSFNSLGDPNGFAMVLVVGIVITMHRATQRQLLLAQCGWMVALLVLGAALVLTQSRGGFLSFLAAVFVYCGTRWGWSRAFLLGSCVLPLAIPYLGRMASLRAGFQPGGTGALRLELAWHALGFFGESPLFGIGYDQFVKVTGRAVHNTFLEAFAELGFWGGTCLLAAFYLSLSDIWNKKPTSAPAPIASQLVGLRACLLAVLTGYAAALMSLSLVDVGITFVILGLGAAYLKMLTESGFVEKRRDIPVVELALISAGFLAGSSLFLGWFLG